MLFILFQIVTALSFLAIYFIPESGANMTVKLDCNMDKAVVKSCYQNQDLIDTCKISRFRNESTFTMCDV